MWIDLVGFVIILWIVFEDLRLLFIVEASNQFINTKIFPPLLAVYEPGILLALADPCEPVHLTSSSQVRHRIYVLVETVAVSDQLAATVLLHDGFTMDKVSNRSV